MKKLLGLLLTLSMSPACTQPEAAPATAASAHRPSDWRNIATEDDRRRLREWRTAWVEALGKARAAGKQAEITKEGVLLDPDSALPFEAPPQGQYACRIIKMGAKRQGLLDYIAYPAFVCTVEAAKDGLRFVKVTGSQRPVGRFYPDAGNRMIFLGTLQLGDEGRAYAYGQDRERDMAGVLHRIGKRRWRLAFPYPHFESTIDVVELIPRP